MAGGIFSSGQTPGGAERAGECPKSVHSAGKLGAGQFLSVPLNATRKLLKRKGLTQVLVHYQLLAPTP